MPLVYNEPCFFSIRIIITRLHSKHVFLLKIEDKKKHKKLFIKKNRFLSQHSLMYSQQFIILTWDFVNEKHFFHHKFIFPY